MISGWSYPPHPASPLTQRRTISDSFAVASSLRRSIVLTSGGGKPVSDFECRGLWGSVVRRRLVVYDLLAPRYQERSVGDHILASVHNNHVDSCHIILYFWKTGALTPTNTSQHCPHYSTQPCTTLHRGELASKECVSKTIFIGTIGYELTFHALGVINKTSSSAKIACGYMPCDKYRSDSSAQDSASVGEESRSEFKAVIASGIFFNVRRRAIRRLVTG
jgi:hypothetical protein